MMKIAPASCAKGRCRSNLTRGQLRSEHIIAPATPLAVALAAQFVRAALLCFALLLVSSPSNCHAKVYYVTEQYGFETLHAMIQNANFNPGLDTIVVTIPEIVLDLSLGAGTLTDIREPVVLEGNGVVIRGGKLGSGGPSSFRIGLRIEAGASGLYRETSCIRMV